MFLRRVGLIMMLMLAGWMPFQSVAAWRAMNIPAFSQSADATGASVVKSATNNVCHDQSGDEAKSMTMTGHHSMQCGSCIPLCGGAPPVSATLREFSPQNALFLKASLPLYKDHIPGVIYPPPVNVIL